MKLKSAETQLTAEQRAALNAHDRSVSLAAGAGCGKTFVLTERFLSYLDPRVLEPSSELPELVAITFTDAAAREMRERIRSRCYERLQETESPDEQQAWRKLIRAMDEARISTIHSFCGALLRSYAAEAGVDPHFDLLSGPATELLRLQTLDNRLRQLLLDRDERLIQLATHFGLQNLRDIVAYLLGGSSQSVLEKWRHATASQLVATWQKYHAEQIVPAAIAIFLEGEPVRLLGRLCETSQVSKEPLQKRFQQILEQLASLPNCESPEGVLGSLRDLAKVRGVSTKKDWHNEDEFAEYRDACTAVRKTIDRSILRLPLVKEHLEETASVGLDLLELVADVSGCYERIKQERNVLEFDDLLAKAYRLLTSEQVPAVRENLNKTMRLLMVDEFQDTDPLQVAIVQALRGAAWAEEGLFVVGDFKQSIYRFRGADPQVSSQLRASLPAEGRLSLTTNFRSQPAILDFVNGLFHDAFEETYEPLVAHRPQLTPTPAVEFMWASCQEGPGSGAEAATKEPFSHLSPSQADRSEEARFIARRLSQMLDSGAELVVDNDSGHPRPLQLGDIALLMRSLSDVNIYEEALREYGLDYYLAGGHAFYAQQEIHDVLHLLRAIASPADDLSLTGALRSPLFSLEDETLFWLAASHTSVSSGLFSGDPIDQLSARERAKVKRAAAAIHDLRQIKDQVLVAELLSTAIARTAYDATLLGEFLGERKLANVQKLLEQARALDRTNPGDLDGFITQLSEFVVRTPKEPLAASRAESDVIRIMTIHYAKGLEFPLVVVPDLSRKAPPTLRRPVFDQQLGPLAAPPTDGKKETCCTGWNIFQFMEQQQELAERKRLFYVACTRAADHLILSSSMKDLEKDLERPPSDWLKHLGERFSLRSGRLRADLPQGYATPEILVTTTAPQTERKPVSRSRGVDLHKLVEKTRSLANAEQGLVPQTVAPIRADAGARKHFSFSQLSGQLVTDADPAPLSIGDSGVALGPDPPSFDFTHPLALDPLALGLDPRGLGTLVHAVLERIDFRKPEEVRELCDTLALLHLEEDWQLAAASAAEMVQQFLASSRAAAMVQAQVQRREVEYLMPWPLHASSPEGRYLHGFMDCLYQDGSGGWHVVDYKSNQVAAAGVPEAAAPYALQMFVYALACERALGVAPVETVLYFLKPGVEYHLQWDAETRTQFTDRLDRAIESQLVSQVSY